jgi:hypothetical protein
VSTRASACAHRRPDSVREWVRVRRADRTLSELTLQCDVCHNWFHAKCVRCPLGPVVPFISNYNVGCPSYSPLAAAASQLTVAGGGS